jgi:excinuclease UvrABC nuclease subunit
MRRFDRKFGLTALATVPGAPGVYRFTDADGVVLYVGKAKDLRRRLAQYRTAGRRQAHRRMRAIGAAAHAFSFEVAVSHEAAELAEIRLIQRLRPRFNIVGAYSGRYPFFGLAALGGELRLCLTSRPEAAAGFELFGAFRSAERAAAAFEALRALFSLAGRQNFIRKSFAGSRRPQSECCFYGLPEAWGAAWTAFFRGESVAALQALAYALLDTRRARQESSAVQMHLEALQEFWLEEAAPLARVIAATGHKPYPVEQAERDILFKKYAQQRAVQDLANGP